MPGPSSFEKKVYEAMDRTDHLGDQFKTWLPRYLRYLSSLQISKQQIPGIMGEIFRNAGDAGQPAFVSPWRHYQTGTSAYGKVRFYKDYMGIVHLDGIAETTGTPGAATSILNLPAGYRPTQAEIAFQQGYNGAHVGTRVDIMATGDVLIANPAVTTFVVNSWVSLFNIHFRAG